MTTHELAKALLNGPNVPAVVGSAEWLGLVEVSVIRIEDAVFWSPDNASEPRIPAKCCWLNFSDEDSERYYNLVDGITP